MDTAISRIPRASVVANPSEASVFSNFGRISHHVCGNHLVRAENDRFFPVADHTRKLVRLSRSTSKHTPLVGASLAGDGALAEAGGLGRASSASRPCEEIERRFDQT